MYEIQKQRLDAEIEAMSARLEQLKGIRKALDDTHLTSLLYGGNQPSSSGAAATPSNSDSATNSGPAPHNGTQYEQIEWFFRNRRNRPASAREIAEGTGISKASVRQVLYKMRPDSFDREPHADGGRETAFRLARVLQKNDNGNPSENPRSSRMIDSEDE